MNDRLVALVDMDCFYCQVETRLNPALKGKPMAVVQYNQWKGGGIIAVNYEARDRGVTRHMRGEEAKKHCPEIQLVSVPAVRGKADLSKYRDAGREVIKVICEFSECVQRASVDEAYIDLTDAVKARFSSSNTKVTPIQLDNTFVVGYSSEDSNDEDERVKGVKAWLQDVYSSALRDSELHRLATAATIVNEMRAAVFEKTGFRCSAGISHNKILAKLICGLHKPNRQTVLPMASVVELYRSLPVKKVRNLGGKLGDDVVQTLGITHMSELVNFSEKQLQNIYDDKNGSWLYNIARGIDLDPVTPQLISKSIGCRKNFPGRTALRSRQNVTHWISELAAELAERLDEDLHMNKRKAQILTVHFSQEVGKKGVAMSRSMPFPGNETEKIAACALNVLSKFNSAAPTSDLWEPSLNYLGVSTGKFVEISGNSGSIDKFFKSGQSSTKDKNAIIVENQNGFVKTANTPLEVKVNDLSKAANSNHTVTSKEQSLEINAEQNNKCSFFERYFKNQPNKIIKNNEVDSIKIVSRNNIPKDNIEFKSDVAPPSTSHNEQYSSSVNSTSTTAKSCITQKRNQTHNVTENIPESSQKNKKKNENNSDEASFISLSEIFPDLENIDDSVINILPSPLQRKISSALKSKNESNLRHVIQQGHGSGVSRASTDSDCAPTRVETEAQIHGLTECHVEPSSYKHSLLQQDCEDDYAVIEAEGLFDTTTLDVFEQESNERIENKRKNSVEDEQSVVCDKCSYCQKSVPICDLPEHLDHHMALQLHEQLNKQPDSTIVRTSKSNEIRQNKSVTVLNSGKKRGRPSKKDSVVTKKMKTIVSFFTKH